MPLFRPCRPCRLGRLRRSPGAPGLRCTHDRRPDSADAARRHARRARGRRRGRHRARPARRPHLALPDARGEARVRERVRRGRGRAHPRRPRYRGAARCDGDPAAGDGRRLMPAVEELYGEIWAAVEALPLADGAADWIWCRDVLPHVRLAEGFAECARVLRPGGRMLAYVTLATEDLEPREAARLFDRVAVRPESMDPAAVEAAAADAG